MKKIKISLVVIFAACLFITSQSSAQVIHDEWVFDVECADGLWVFCLEEPVYGHVVYNVHSKFDKDGNPTNLHFNIKGGKLTGCETGKVYKVMNSGNEVIKINKKNPQEVYSYTEKLMYIADKGKKYIMTWKVYFRVNANGEIIKEYIEIVDCD
ncbi:MAG: hypothetical protein QNK30_14845 [Bacteroidales bacterium]|nr:hypothetical protein [Bacteroidales bacterium]